MDPEVDDDDDDDDNAEAATLIPAFAKYFAEVISGSAPAAGRSDVVAKLASILGTRVPQVPLVVAPAGAGRTTLARCLAAFLAEPGNSSPLAGAPVVLVRAEKLLNQPELAPMELLLGALPASSVVFVDDVDVLTRLGQGDVTSVAALATLRSMVGRQEARLVLSVAREFIDRLQQTDGELFGELERFDVPPMTDEELLTVVLAEATELEAHHKVDIPEAVRRLVLAPPKQADTLSQPGLAVARLDRAAAAAVLRVDRVVTVADLGLTAGGQDYLQFDREGLIERLSASIKGQSEALVAVVSRLEVTRARLDLRPERPDGVFLFAGPTGTGKTLTAQMLAEGIYGTADALIRLDMSEYSEAHTIALLVGSPPGYRGSTETDSWLTTRIRSRPQSVLLLDEIEKADPAIWNAFPQVLDSGKLTDSQGRVADFRDVIVVMTTNIGGRAFEESDAGFAPGTTSVRAASKGVLEQVGRSLPPELRNRFDEILVFRPLALDTIAAITRLKVGEALALLAQRGWALDVDDSVYDLIARVGFSPDDGARPLLRAIESHLIGQVARQPPGSYHATARDDSVTVVPV